MQIKRSIEKVPGGITIIPLLSGAVIYTLFPNAAKFFGAFTGAWMTGAMPLLAVTFFCVGTSIDARATPAILKKGGVLLISKVSCGAIAGLIAAQDGLVGFLCRTVRAGNNVGDE